MFEAQKIVAESLKSDIELQDFSYNARLWFFLSVVVFMPWFFFKAFNLKN